MWFIALNSLIVVPPSLSESAPSLQEAFSINYYHFILIIFIAFILGWLIGRFKKR